MLGGIRRGGHQGRKRVAGASRKKVKSSGHASSCPQDVAKIKGDRREAEQLGCAATSIEECARQNWAEEETAKMYKQAKQIVELMDNEEHHKVQNRKDQPTEGDWRGRPSVVALPTELAAVLAERHGGDMEQVKKLSNRLVNALKQSDYTVCFQELRQ